MEIADDVDLALKGRAVMEMTWTNEEVSMYMDLDDIVQLLAGAIAKVKG